MRILVLLTALLALLAALAPPSFGACALSRTVTVNVAMTPSTLTGYVVQVTGTFDGTSSTPDLRSVTNGGKTPNADTNGFSIGFFSDSLCASILPYEKSVFDPVTGQDEFFVRPTTTVSPVYIRYGDPAIVSDLSNPTAVWSGYAASLHFGTPSSLSIADSTGNNTTTNHGATAGSGHILGAATFNGSSNVSLGTNAAMNITGAITISAWVKMTGGSACTILGAYSPGAFNGFALSIASAGGIPKPQMWNSNVGSWVTSAGINVNDGAWHHITFTNSNGSNLTFYIDGVIDGPYAFSGAPMAAYTGEKDVGSDSNNSAHQCVGLIDDFVTLPSEMTAAWNTALYNNGSSPSTFIAFGPETGGGGASPPHRLRVVTH